MADATYDLIIIGGGAIGLSTAYHAGMADVFADWGLRNHRIYVG